MIPQKSNSLNGYFMKPYPPPPAFQVNRQAPPAGIRNHSSRKQDRDRPSPGQPGQMPVILLITPKSPRFREKGSVLHIYPSDKFIVRRRHPFCFIPHGVAPAAAKPHDIRTINPIIEIDKVSPIFLAAMFLFQTHFHIAHLPAADFRS